MGQYVSRAFGGVAMQAIVDKLQETLERDRAAWKETLERERAAWKETLDRLAIPTRDQMLQADFKAIATVATRYCIFQYKSNIKGLRSTWVACV